MSIECLSESMTVREIIRARIYQEVTDYNQKVNEEQASLPQLLVTPTETEAKLNHAATNIKTQNKKKRQTVDWEKQFALACEAFQSNGFFMLVEDKQATDLDEEFMVQTDTEISFVKLTPLVGR